MFPWKLNFGFHHFPTTNCRFAAKFVDFLLIVFSLTPASNEDEKFPAIHYYSVFHIITYPHIIVKDTTNAFFVLHNFLEVATYLLGLSNGILLAFVLKQYIIG